MTPGELRIALRSALSLCQKIKAPQGHWKACYDDVMQEPEKDWPFYISHFNNQAKPKQPDEG